MAALARTAHLFTVATGLMTSTHPTLDLPRPAWVPAHHRWWLGVLIGFAAAAAVDLARRRYRRRSR